MQDVKLIVQEKKISLQKGNGNRFQKKNATKI